MAIISGGFGLLADRTSRELQIGIVYANRFMVRDGVVEGIRRPIETPRLKSDLMANIAGQLGLEMSECVAVGDGANDLPMMEVVGLSIAFNAKKAVRERADVVVDAEDLRDILQCIKVLRGRKMGNGFSAALNVSLSASLRRLTRYPGSHCLNWGTGT